jgi:CubicO group peptidase (beta-lactamase class C family)
MDVEAWQDRLTELLEKHGVPGVSVAALAGDEVSAVAAGVLNTATGVSVTTDSLFQIGSVTKVWTATVLMRLAEQGRVGPDTPVQELLPEFRVADAEVSRRVTLRHLLTHTSGIDGDFFHDTGRGDDCLARYVAACAGLEQVHPLGATMSYCNTGYAVLGRVVERLTGAVWDDALRDLLIEPLGLTRTWTLAEDVLRYRAALGHDTGTDGVLRPAAVWGLPRSLGPAGTINATAADVLALARLHLRGGVAPDGARLLSGRAVAEMRVPQVEVPTAWDKGDRWGLGWALFDRGGLCGHDGSTIGQRARLRVAPDRGVAVAVLANSETAGPLISEVTGALLHDLTGLVPAQPLAPPAEPEPVDPAELDRCAGGYERTAVRYEVIRREAGLVLRVSENDDLGAGPTDYDVELTALPGGRFAGRWPFQTEWTPVRFLRVAGADVLHVSGRATPRVTPAPR